MSAIQGVGQCWTGRGRYTLLVAAEEGGKGMRGSEAASLGGVAGVRHEGRAGLCEAAARRRGWGEHPSVTRVPLRPPVSLPNPRCLCPLRYAAFGCYNSDALGASPANSSAAGPAASRPGSTNGQAPSSASPPPPSSGLSSSCPGSTKLHLDMSDAVNLLAYVHGSASPLSQLGGVAASCADEFQGREGEWLARQRGAVGEWKICWGERWRGSRGGWLGGGWAKARRAGREGVWAIREERVLHVEDGVLGKDVYMWHGERASQGRGGGRVDGG